MSLFTFWENCIDIDKATRIFLYSASVNTSCPFSRINGQSFLAVLSGITQLTFFRRHYHTQKHRTHFSSICNSQYFPVIMSRMTLFLYLCALCKPEHCLNILKVLTRSTPSWAGEGCFGAAPAPSLGDTECRSLGGGWGLGSMPGPHLQVPGVTDATFSLHCLLWFELRICS